MTYNVFGGTLNPTLLCLSVCVCVYLTVCLHDNSKTSDPQVFKLGREDDLGVSSKCYDFGVKRSRS